MLRLELEAYFLHFRAKKEATDAGGKITHESKLIKSITYVFIYSLPAPGNYSYRVWSVEFPKDAVHSLSTNDHYTVEKDGEVKTQ